MASAEDVALKPDPVLSTTEVGALFDVHPSTVKRWCDRGDLSFERTEGGHRRIPLSQVLRRARSEGQVLPLSAFGSDAGTVWLAGRAAEERDFGPTQALLRRWLEGSALDRISDFLVHLCAESDAELPLIFDSGIRDLMEAVGARWADGRMGSGVEHQVSEAMTGALHRIRRLAAREGSGRPGSDPERVALVGCAEGERHVLGARCVRIALELEGWEVRFLGADVPLEEWITLQREYGARLLCISYSRMRCHADLLRATRLLASAYDSQRSYALALGGAARVEAPPSGAWPFSDLRFFPDTAGLASWLEAAPDAVGG